MTRFFFCISMLAAVVALSYGQQNQRTQLQFEDISDPLAVWAENGAAAVVIVCDDRIKLTFDSDVGAVNVYKTELKGGDMYYTLRFQVGSDNVKRSFFNVRGVYNITSETDRVVYEPVKFAIELNPKEMKTFYLSDPNIDVLGGCYGRTTKEGLDAFRKGLYTDAKLRYEQVKDCDDTPATVFDDIDRKIADIDKILRFRDEADNLFISGDYQKAYDYYMTASGINPDDSFLKDRMTECMRRTGMTGVTTEKATPDSINKKAERRRQRTFVMAYENSILVGGIYGGSLGWYRDKKVGVSLAARTGKANNVHAGYDYGRIDELSASFGLTFRLFRMTKKDYRKWPWGVWMSLNGGYAIAKPDNSYYYYNEDFYKSFAPEAGLLMKMGFLAVKYTYQYRIDFPGDFKTRNFVGIGLCF